MEKAHELRPIYFNKPSPTQDKIMWVKLIASFKLQETGHPYYHTNEWEILCQKESTEVYEYKPITEILLQECALAPLVYQWKIDFNAIFNEEHASGKKSNDHLIDPHDPKRPPDDMKYGILEQQYPFYLNTSHMSLYSGNATGCISAVRYDSNRETYIGQIQYPNGTTENEILTEQWVKDNFDENFMKALSDASSKRKQRYVMVPPGDVRLIRPQFIKRSNPVIKYPQGTENTCVFSAMTSVMHYLGFAEDAEKLDVCRKLFYDSPSHLEKLEGVMKHVVYCVQTNCKRFISNRMQKVLNLNFDVVNHQFLRNEIAIITLWAENGDRSHTVAICNNFIFDSNANHALDFNRASLDECSAGKFARVWKGYYFHQRKENPKNWLKLMAK
jgi:hypothetical protein